jgi:Fe-S oxidoreductase/nitrate reductase gamma subunit
MQPTREIFGNIAPWMQGIFYLLIIISVVILIWRFWLRLGLWRSGVAGEFERDWRVWLKRLVTYALYQKRVHRKSLGGILHVFLFSGFAVLFVGTTLLFIADKGPVYFHRGMYYLFYELTMDIFGVAFGIGCTLALLRRLAVKPASLGHNFLDWVLLSLLFTIFITGFFLEAFRLQYNGIETSVAHWSPVGCWLSLIFNNIITQPKAQLLHLVTWWIHTTLVVLFFSVIPFTRFFHVITGILNIALHPSRPGGALSFIAMSDVMEIGHIGVSAINHFTRQQLLSLDACMECGRCQDACPAYAANKPLSPMSVVRDLKNMMEHENGLVLHGDVIRAETLWACTMCQACVHECPVLIGHVDIINDLRRNLVGNGQIFGPPAQALRRIGKQFNPYGQIQQERTDWAKGLNIPTVKSNPGFEYLLWVGCMASFDPRVQKIAQATVQLLTHAGVNFAIFGDEEKCTGDTARRIGDEFLFQELAQANIKTLKKYNVSKIVTPCPHGYNTFKNEYPQLEGSFVVQHHSQLFAELILSGKIKIKKKTDETVTLHDPCYLARVNNEVVASRAVIERSIDSNIIYEMPRHGKNTFCCGAGGGRMWFEETPEQRVSLIRAKEVLRTGANVLATACPFCLNMMSDAMATVTQGDQVRVMDISELLNEAI